MPLGLWAVPAPQRHRQGSRLDSLHGDDLQAPPEVVRDPGGPLARLAGADQSPSPPLRPLTALLTRERQLPRLVDNINVSPSGRVYVASFPKPLQLGHLADPKVVEAGFKDPKTGEDVRVATEVWRVSNATGQERFHGGKLQLEKVRSVQPMPSQQRWTKNTQVFADDGGKVSCSTNVLAHNNRIYLTGPFPSDTFDDAADSLSRPVEPMALRVRGLARARRLMTARSRAQKMKGMRPAPARCNSKSLQPRGEGDGEKM